MRKAQDMKASEIFLRLMRYRTTHDENETFEDFRFCAEAWAKICWMEALAKGTIEEEPADEDAPDPPEEAAPEEETPKKAEQRPGMAVAERKRQIRERILKARQDGISAASIAEAAGGSVTDTTVYQIINAEKVDIRAYERIALALDKLLGKEEGDDG